MREFVENKSRKPTEVKLFGEQMIVDLKSTDCIRDYTKFMLKKVWRQQFGSAPGYDIANRVYVDRNNGNIQISGDGARYWSSDTVRNIKNFIDNQVQQNVQKHEDEQAEEQRKQQFAQNLIRKYPNLKFDEPNVNGNYVTVDVEINGVEVSIDSDWEVTYGIPDTKRNAEKLIDFLQHTHFDLEVDEDEDD